MSRHFVYISLFFMNVFVVQAQNTKEDFMRLNKSYEKFQDLSFDIEYTVYANYTSHDPIDHKFGFYKKKGKLYYNKLMGFENLVTGNETIAVDSVHKNIFIYPSKKVSQSKVAMIDFEKSMSKFKKIQTAKRGDNERGYKIQYQDTVISEYEKIEFYYSEDTYLMTEMILYYRRDIDFSESFPSKKGEKPRLDIKFKNINTQPKYGENEFSASNFISEKSGRKFASAKYIGYKVYDQKLK
jgi:hypothetical protein